MSQGAVNILIVSAISRLGLVTQFVHFRLCDRFQLQKREDSCIFCWKKLDPSLYCYITIHWRWYRHHWWWWWWWWWWCPNTKLFPNRGVYLYWKKSTTLRHPFWPQRNEWVRQNYEHGLNKDWNIPWSIAWAHTIISQGFPTHMSILWTDFVCHLGGGGCYTKMDWCGVKGVM